MKLFTTKTYLALLLFIFTSAKSYCTVYTTKNNGDYGSASSWIIKPPPVIGVNDTIIINHNITLITNEDANGTWIINTGVTFDGTNNTLTIKLTGHLIIKGVIKLKNLNNDGNITMENGRAEIYGNLLNNNSSNGINGTNGIFRLQNRAINNAGGTIMGTINFCRFDEVSDPILSNSGYIDWTTVSVCGGTLPIELITFNAISEAKGIKINWTTSTEDESIGFDLEKSYDGNKFIKVKYLNQNANKEYSYIDANEKHELVYYRLKSYTSSGGAESSEIISVNQEGNELFEVFPNPCSCNDKLFIKVNQSNLSNCNLVIFNSQGEILICSELGVDNMPESEIALSSGVYLLQITSDTNSSTKKIVIE